MTPYKTPIPVKTSKNTAKSASNTTFNIQNGLIMGHIPPPPYLPNSKNRILVGKFEFKGQFKSGRTYWADRVGLPLFGQPLLFEVNP